MGRIVVVGSTNTDMTVRVPRIPRPGETVLGRDFRVTAGGKGANQAVAAARAGGSDAGSSVVFVTALGADDFGQRALESFVRDGIDISAVRQVAGAASGVALIAVDEAGENSIAVAPGANGELRPEDVEPVAAGLGPSDVVLLQLEIPIATVEAAARTAAARGARVILNPAPARPLHDSLLGCVSLLTPNEAEAEQLACSRDMVITLGARGAAIRSGGRSELVPAFQVRAVDTTAAGDVFNGALAVAFVEGRPLADAVRFANAAAALSVMRPGAQDSAPRRAEIDALLADQRQSTT